MPEKIGPHVPFAMLMVFVTLHAMQVPVQAVLQHTSSTQKPLMQLVPDVHEVPSGIAQAPAPLHTPAPEHSLSGSKPKPMSPQTPFDPLPFFWALHAWQKPLQVVS